MIYPAPARKHLFFLRFFLLLCASLTLAGNSYARFGVNDTIRYIGSTTFCAPGTLNLIANNAPANAVCQWYNGTTVIPGATSSSYTASQSGNYTVTVSTPAGLGPYNNLSVTVNPVPVANFTASPNNQCGSVPVIFTNTSTGSVTYLWNFGDPNSGANNTSIAANPTHRFVGTAGNGNQTFNVTLTVTSSQGCINSKQQMITIKQNPGTKLDGPNPKIYNGINYFTECSGTSTTATLDFLNASTTSATNTSYQIVWGDGQPFYISSTFNGIVPHTYNRGNYLLLFIVTGSNNCVDTGYYSVFVGSNPYVSLVNPGNTIICTGSSITFPIIDSGSNTNETTYTFSVNDGTPVVNLLYPPPNSISHTFNTTSCGTNGLTYPNSFVASLVASNPCLTSTSPVVPIYVSEKPVAGITISPKDTICVNTLTTITNTSASNTYVTAPTCSPGRLVWTLTPATGWMLSNGNFGNDNGSPNPGSWSSLATQSLGVSFNTIGVYTIKLKVGNPNCGKDSIIRTICVNPTPVGAFSVDNITGCAPLTVTTTNTSNSPSCGSNTYTWSVSYVPHSGCMPNVSDYTTIGSTTLSSVNPQFIFNNPGIYTISLVTKSSGGVCVAPAVTRQILVKAKPTVGINTLPIICIGNTISPGSSSYNCGSTVIPVPHWTFIGGTPDTSNILQPGPIRYDSIGNYPVTFTLQNECGISNTANATVQVMGKPDVNAGPNKETCSGIAVTIGVNTGNYTYSWSPATGLSNPNIATPTVTRTYTGSSADTTFKYYLTVSSGSNCSNKDSVLVKVSRKPAIVVTPATAVNCNGSGAILIATGATTYSWNNANTLSNSNKDTVIAFPTGTVAVTYTVTGTLNGCTNTATAVVTPRIVKAGDSTMCNSSTAVQLSGTPAGGTWSGHPALTPGGIFNPNAAGIGVYNLIYMYLGCADTAQATVTNGDSASAGNDLAICQHAGTIQLIGFPAGGTWGPNPPVTPTGSLTTSIPGVFSLIYRTGSGSCIARDTVVITINGGIANNLITGNQGFCSGGQPASLIGQAITGGGGGLPAYQWQSRDSTSTMWNDIPAPQGTAQNYTPPVVITTVYYRRIAATSLCTGMQRDTSSPVKITLNPDAKAIFTPTRTVSCNPFNITADTINLTPYSNANSQYQWYVNGSPWSSNQTFPTYTMYNPGDSITIKLVAISRYGCKNDSMQVGFKTIPRPLPAFTQTDSVGCGPLTVTFTNNTPNASQYSYLWLFGTGIPSMVQQPGPITFPTNPLSGDTVYTVRFITISQCSRDTLVRYVWVKSKPKALFTPDRSTGCSTYNFAFTNTSRGIGNTYVWNYGDGSPLDTTQAAVVHHIYHVAGNTTFQVKLKATNECGSDSLIYNIVVQPISIHLDFAINGSNRYGCLPHTVSFINNSQGGNIFTYDFGDGTLPVPRYQNIDTVPHTYTTTGTFTVVLRGKNDCSDTTDTELVTVYPKPSVSFTASPLIACFGDTIRFINTSDTGLVNNWRFGDGFTSPLRSPVHIYNSGGNYRVWYTGTKAYPSGTNCADSTYKDIIIRDTLAGSFSASDTVAGCTPATIIFKNNNRPSAGTTWTFGDGSTATGDSVSHNYLLPGSYMVKMISHGLAGCTYTATKTVVVTSPGGTLLYNGGYLCPGIPLRMEVIANSTTQQIKYVYGDGDSTITTAPVVFHNYLQPGIYVPYAYAIAGSCRAKLVRGDTIKVDKLRTGFTTQNVQQCGSTTVMFTDTSFAYFGIQSRIWSFGDGTTSVQQNPVHNYTQSGTYPVRLRITGVSGCTDTALVQVTVSVRNFPVSTISGNVLSCIGQPLPLTALVQSGDSISSYNWNFGNGTIGSGQNVTATYNVAGSYTIRLISRTAFGCADTAYKTIMVNAAPFVDAGPDPFAICRGNSTQLSAIGVGVTSWQWSPLQNLSCTTCPNPMANPLFTTTYVVTGSNGALCKGTDTIVVEVIQPFRITVSPTAVFCYPDSVRLMAAGANTYLWSPAASLDNANISNPLARPAATTVYQVVGKGRNNCFSDTGYVRVNVGQYPIVDLGNGGTVTAGTPVTMNPVITNGPIIRYRWTPPTDLSCTNCLRPTAIINKDISYRLEVENNFGCIGSDTINYRVNCKEDQLFIPNAFSPDGDGTNDVLMVRGKGISVVKYFRIFNRWGQLVFERSNINVNDLQQGWDGKVNGLAAQPDVYVYTVEALCSGGATFTRTGNVSLIK